MPTSRPAACVLAAALCLTGFAAVAIGAAPAAAGSSEPTCSISVANGPPGADPGTCTVGAPFQSSLGTTYPFTITNTPITNTTWMTGVNAYSIGAFGQASVDMTAPVLIDPSDCMKRYGFIAVDNGNAISTTNPGPYDCTLDIAGGSTSGTTVIKWTDDSTGFGFCSWQPPDLDKVCYNSGPEFDIAITWNPNTAPPVAHMNYFPDGKAPGEFTFDGSPSTAAAGATIASYHWVFSDGTTADTTAPTTTVTHRFASEGTPTVTLTVKDSNGLTGTDTETIGPSLRVEGVTFDPPVARPNSTVAATLTLENDGNETVHGVAPTMTSDKPAVASPGAAPAAADIGPAQSGGFTFPVTTGADGKGVLTVGGSGTTASGTAVTAASKPVDLVVGNPGILVDITGEQPKQNDEFAVKVTLTNPGADDITGLTYGDPSGLAEADVASNVGVATLEAAADIPPRVLHAHESVPLTYTYLAGTDGSAVFTSMVMGTTADDVNGGTKTVTDTSSMSVTVSDPTPKPADLDAAAQIAWDQAGQLLAGGYQNAQNILGNGLVTNLGLPQPTEADYEGIRSEGLSPGLAALAENPQGLNAFGQGFGVETRKLVTADSQAAGQSLVAIYSAAKDPQTWSTMASAAYNQTKSLPAAALANGGYLAQAVLASQTPDGIAQGLSDTVAAGQSATTALNTAATNAANALTDEILANRALAKSDPTAYEMKMGGYVADAQVGLAKAAVSTALGDGAFKAASPGLKYLAGRVGLGAMESAAQTAEAGASIADAAGDSTVASQAAGAGTGSTSSGLASLDGAVSQLQQLGADTVLSTADASQLGGFLPSDVEKINTIIASVKRDYNVDLEIGVRTSEPLSLGKDITPKPEIIKPKAVSVMDRLLGAPQDAEGYATVYEPKPLSAEQVADYEAQQPGFAQAYQSRLAAQQSLYSDYVNGKTNLSTLVEASKDGPVTAVLGRPTTVGQFVMPQNLVYLEQLDDPAYLAANGLTPEYAQGLKAQMLQSYPDLTKVQIGTVTRPDGSITFTDELKGRPYGSDLDVQYVRPANGADWPAGERGQIETDVNAQMRQLSRYPNHGWSDAATDLNTAYYAAAAKFQMGTVNPALAGQQANAIFARYQLAEQILDQQSGLLAFQAAVETDPTRRALLQAQSLSLHKSALKFAGTTLADIQAYGSGEKIIIFSPGDIRVGYTPPVGHALFARALAARDVVAPPPEHWTVTSLADGPAALDGSCEAGAATGCALREALAEASNTLQPVVVMLPAGTITLTGGPLVLTGGSVTLTGAGTTLDGGGASGLIQTVSGSLSISGMTLTGGFGSGDAELPGAAITADGTVVSLADTTVSGSHGDAPGGGVFVGDGGSLTVLRATFSDDQATDGGAVSVQDSALSITSSTFSGDGSSEDGGAVQAVSALSLSITGSTFTGNSAGQRGGALFVDGAGGPVTLTDDTFTNNTAGAEGGAVAARDLVSTGLAGSTLAVTGGSFGQNTARTGGAISSDDGPVSLSGTTFTDNDAGLGDGGAITTSGPLTVDSATFTGNTAHADGGAISAGNTATIDGATFTGNTAGGLGGSLALLGPGDDSLTSSTIDTSTAPDGGSAVWRDGGHLTTPGTDYGTALLETLNGQPAVAPAPPIPPTPPTPETYVATGPTRILDTRIGLGAPEAPVRPRGTITLTVPNLPAGTTAVVLNLAGTRLTDSPFTYVSACPAAQSLANCTKTSALTVIAGVDVANEITVPVGPDGRITLYNNAGSIDLVADLVGYQTGGYTATGPTRILDTRIGLGAPEAQVGPRGTITLTVPNLPAGTTAVVLNLAGTRLTDSPFTYVSSCPAAQSLVSCTKTSALNVIARVDIANEITVPVAPDGKITLYNNEGSIDLVADLVGYQTGGYVATGPTRILDTRTGTGAPKSPVAAADTITLTVPNLPPGTTAVVLNLTGTHLTGSATTYVSACPAADSLTACTRTSALNVIAGRDVANEITVPVAANGKITLYNNTGATDLVADLVGYQTGGS